MIQKSEMILEPPIEYFDTTPSAEHKQKASLNLAFISIYYHSAFQHLSIHSQSDLCMTYNPRTTLCGAEKNQSKI